MIYKYEDLLKDEVSDLNSEMFPDKEVESIQKELSIVYHKARALDDVVTIVEDKEDYYSNEFIETVESAVDSFLSITVEETLAEINRMVRAYEKNDLDDYWLANGVSRVIRRYYIQEVLDYEPQA
ncbi:hypothetical protein [Mammaliicoccus sciuri]|uniref:hypothetical protein n=1 Tax=Mammaliicoccus sciuri TaxID=1296 RepID=UPI000D1E5379|nr:hypothetical protein [Mammaliicoccus sciuri]PTJ54233.1 hypothetical protein BU012_01150 [Mammaliicoccus sciuri]